MKSILLIGLGRFGQHIARKLYERNHQVLAIDKEEERVNAVLPYVTSAQIGDSTSEEFLSTIGVRNFDVCIVAIGDDFQNSLETTNLLKEMGAKKVIARATRERQEKFLFRNGADEVAYPEKQMAAWIAIRCSSEHILDYVAIGDDYSIMEIEVPEQWHGKSLLQLDVRRRYGINILGVREKQQLTMTVGPEMVFRKGQSVLLLGQEKALQKCFHI